jgi:hypothetical protein
MRSLRSKLVGHERRKIAILEHLNLNFDCFRMFASRYERVERRQFQHILD